MRRATMRGSRISLLLKTLALMVAAMSLAIAGCSTSRPPSGPAGIVGQIKTVQHTGSDWSILVIGGKQAAGAVSDRAMCRIDSSTRIVDSNGSRIAPEDLSVGSTVAVWFSGAVAESYPVQGTAAYIRVRSPAE